MDRLLHSDFRIFCKDAGWTITKRDIVRGCKPPDVFHQGDKRTNKSHITRSIIKICQRTHESVAILQLELAKAFERARHSFLSGPLKHIGV